VTAESRVPLAEQRRLLRAQLGTQRQRLSDQLAAAGRPREGFPRSVTVRWLIREPELVSRLVGGIAGRRVAAAMPSVLLLVRFLSTSIAATPRLPAPHSQ
jgi:hypothetical protein